MHAEEWGIDIAIKMHFQLSSSIDEAMCMVKI
jgi:hypothetical protein